MIYFPFTKGVDSSESKVAPGAIINAEGIALVRVNGAQADGVQPSTGNGTDLFVGFSVAGTTAAPFPEGFFNKVETLIVPASGAVTLQFAPVTGQTAVFNITTNAPVATPTVVGKQVTGLATGSEVRITYKYVLSVVAARAIYGDVGPGGYSGAYVGQIGVMRRGVIYTAEYDASVNWAAATAVKLDAGGLVTDQTGSGVAINARIIAVPGDEVPYLGLEFSAP